MNTATTAPPLNAFAGAAQSPSFLTHGWETIRSLFGCRQRNEKLERLVAQYRTLSFEDREANRAAAQMIETAAANARQRSASWSEIAAVERALLSLLTGQDLRRFGWLLRAEFEKAVSAVAADQILLKAYRDSNPPDLETPDEARLKADLLALQDRLHELCATRRVQIRARNRIACWTVVSTLAIFVTLQLNEILNIQSTIVFDVFGVGMLGGVFSTLLRIQKCRLGGAYEAAALTQPGNQLIVILAPVIGGVGAILLFVMLAAGVLQGTLFPQLSSAHFNGVADALEQIFQIHLASAPDAAKLYLLCFLAGFSERMVPDVMSRLAATAER